MKPEMIKLISAMTPIALRLRSTLARSVRPRPNAAFIMSPKPMSSTRSAKEGVVRLQLKLSAP